MFKNKLRSLVASLTVVSLLGASAHAIPSFDDILSVTRNGIDASSKAISTAYEMGVDLAKAAYNHPKTTAAIVTTAALASTAAYFYFNPEAYEEISEKAIEQKNALSLYVRDKLAEIAEKAVEQKDMISLYLNGKLNKAKEEIVQYAINSGWSLYTLGWKMYEVAEIGYAHGAKILENLESAGETALVCLKRVSPELEQLRHGVSLEQHKEWFGAASDCFHLAKLSLLGSQASATSYWLDLGYGFMRGASNTLYAGLAALTGGNPIEDGGRIASSAWSMLKGGSVSLVYDFIGYYTTLSVAEGINLFRNLHK